MKRFCAGVVLGFLASLGMGWAAPNFDHNGNFWNKLNTSAKTGYINGYGDAMQVSAGKLDRTWSGWRWFSARKTARRCII